MTTKDNVTFEVILQEDKETGDLILPLPDELLDQMGWKEGDNLEWFLEESGSIVLKKV